MNLRAISTTIASHPSSSPIFTHSVSYNVFDCGIIRSHVVTESSLEVHSNNESVKSSHEPPSSRIMTTWTIMWVLDLTYYVEVPTTLPLFVVMS